MEEFPNHRLLLDQIFLCPLLRWDLEIFLHHQWVLVMLLPHHQIFHLICRKLIDSRLNLINKILLLETIQDITQQQECPYFQLQVVSYPLLLQWTNDQANNLRKIRKILTHPYLVKQSLIRINTRQQAWLQQVLQKECLINQLWMIRKWINQT